MVYKSRKRGIRNRCRFVCYKLAQKDYKSRHGLEVEITKRYITEHSRAIGEASREDWESLRRNCLRVFELENSCHF